VTSTATRGAPAGGGAERGITNERDCGTITFAANARKATLPRDGGPADVRASACVVDAVTAKANIAATVMGLRISATIPRLLPWYVPVAGIVPLASDI
jgi:hypothetical protein